MRPGKWGSCERVAGAVWRNLIVWLGAALVLWACGTAWANDHSVYPLTAAQASLEPEGGPPWEGELSLPHRWDTTYPGRAGRARYRFELPAVERRGELWGVYFPRVGNQVEVYVAGDLLVHLGTLGDSSLDAAKVPVWAPIPARLLAASGPTVLEVRVAAQPGRWGGLATPQFGPESRLLPLYRERYAWRQWGTVAVVLALAFTGAVAAGLWRVQRDAVYGYAALAAPFGILRYIDRLVEVPPLGWPLWGGVMAMALVLHVLMLSRFAVALVDRDGAVPRRVFWAVLACEAVLVAGAFAGGWPQWWTVGLALLFVPAMLAYAVALHEAVKTREAEAIALCAACFIPIAAGLHDFLAVRISNDGQGRSTTLALATMLFVLLVGWLILHRYTRQVRAYDALRNSLDEKVRVREQELRASYARLQQEHAQHAALQERQRIMRDIHDGVGSQLVGLLSLIGKGRASRTQLKEHANAALDELRMAVDAMQTVDGDLATVLATLRYRLQPRLAATGIQVDWQVEELPTLDSLTPHMVLQIQRILLEAFTNVLRHAQATRVRVSARHQPRGAADAPPCLLLEIADNGVGMPQEATATAGGHGLANMRARAQAIGAVLEVTATPGQGTWVRIALPVAPAAPATPATPTPAPAVPAAPST